MKKCSGKEEKEKWGREKGVGKGEGGKRERERDWDYSVKLFIPTMS